MGQGVNEPEAHVESTEKPRHSEEGCTCRSDAGAIVGVVCARRGGVIMIAYAWQYCYWRSISSSPLSNADSSPASCSHYSNREC